MRDVLEFIFASWTHFLGTALLLAIVSPSGPIIRYERNTRG